MQDSVHGRHLYCEATATLKQCVHYSEQNIKGKASVCLQHQLIQWKIYWDIHLHGFDFVHCSHPVSSKCSKLGYLYYSVSILLEL